MTRRARMCGGALAAALGLSVIAQAGAPPADRKVMTEGIVRALEAVTAGRWNVTWRLGAPPDDGMPAELTLGVASTPKLLQIAGGVVRGGGRGAKTDPWSSLIAAKADREAAIAALGKPEVEYDAAVEKGARPFQVHSGYYPLKDPELVYVLDFRGSTGAIDWQIVFRDGKADYAIAPPLNDESDLAAVTK